MWSTSTPERDWQLRNIVELAEKNDFHFNIWLNMASIVATGKLIGSSAWFEAVKGQLSQDAGATPEIWNQFQEHERQLSLNTDQHFIHLKDASVAYPSGTADVAYWRGLAAEILAWGVIEG
jgi:hypothetical protein